MAARKKTKGAVVLLSGGMDSATTLAVARKAGWTCHAIAVAYGQRHKAELKAARTQARLLGAQSFHITEVTLDGIGGSALTNRKLKVPQQRRAGIPITYVPARNTIFLSIALAWAEVLKARAIFIGVNAVDYSGYPDCRPEFIAAFQKVAAVATRAAVEGSATCRIHTPLIRLSKAAIIRRGMALGVDYRRTVSCYCADDAGRACGRCDACRIRRDGFVAAKVPDRTRYQ